MSTEKRIVALSEERLRDAIMEAFDIEVSGVLFPSRCERLLGLLAKVRPTHRHYKGGLYEVLSEEVTPEWLPEARFFLYRSEEGRLWVRPVGELEDSVEVKQRRFSSLDGVAEDPPPQTSEGVQFMSRAIPADGPVTITFASRTEAAHMAMTLQDDHCKAERDTAVLGIRSMINAALREPPKKEVKP